MKCIAYIYIYVVFVCIQYVSPHIEEDKFVCEFLSVYKGVQIF